MLHPARPSQKKAVAYKRAEKSAPSKPPASDFDPLYGIEKRLDAVYPMSNIDPHCWQRVHGRTVDNRDFHIGDEDFELFDQILQCVQTLLVRNGIHRPSDGAVEYIPFIFKARLILFGLDMGERQYDWNLLVRRVFQSDHDRFLRYIRNMTRTDDVIWYITTMKP